MYAKKAILTIKRPIAEKQIVYTFVVTNAPPRDPVLTCVSDTPIALPDVVSFPLSIQEIENQSKEQLDWHRGVNRIPNSEAVVRCRRSQEEFV
jgi:hypothetical protein